jgi:nitrogen-specific signal transduction histidine kinase
LPPRGFYTTVFQPKKPVKPSIQKMREPDPAAPSQREFQLQQDRAFKSMNQLARGVAHDFNNVLAGIITGAGLIKMEMAANPEQPFGDILEQIFASNGRAQDMVRQLVEFSRRQPAERALILLPPVVEESLPALRSVIPATIEITHVIEPECPAILADAAQIRQVVMSLGTHVGHSLAGHKNGRIQVRLDTCDVGADLAAAQLGLRAGPHVRLAISGNSGQVSKAVLDRMFEPFACKQADGHNCGLELFAAREIVHAHGGAVTVGMVPGAGLVLHLYFPIPDSL